MYSVKTTNINIHVHIRKVQNNPEIKLLLKAVVIGKIGPAFMIRNV